MDITSILTKLVSISSVSDTEAEIADYIQELIQRRTQFNVVRRNNNLLVHIPGVNKRTCFIFNGHIDTVSPGDRQLWYTDPLLLTESDGKLYGLGASDMKGADAVYIKLILDYVNTPPPCDVYVMFVAQEETTGAGTKEMLAYMQEKQLLQEYEYVAGVIGESTALGVELGHRGNAFFEVQFRGVGGHGSRPPEGDKQAIQQAAAFITSLEERQSQWRKKYVDELLGDPTVSVTQVVAGADGSMNQMPTSCVVRLDVRTNAAFHPYVMEEIKVWAESCKGGAKMVSASPIGYCDNQETIAQVAMSLVEQTSGSVSRGSTDQCFFTEAGIPAIICGPGVRSTIHAPNEYVEKASLQRALQLYRTIIDEVACKNPSPLVE